MLPVKVNSPCHYKVNGSDETQWIKGFALADTSRASRLLTHANLWPFLIYKIMKCN